MNVFIPNCSTIPYALSCPASVIVLAAQTTQHYSKIAMDSKAPVDKGSKEATFTALTADFGFDEKITLFLKGPMEDLEDFPYYFSDEKEIDAFVAAEGTLKGPPKGSIGGFRALPGAADCCAVVASVSSGTAKRE